VSSGAKLWLLGAFLLGFRTHQHGRRVAARAFASMAVASVLSNLVLKPLVGRNRPSQADSGGVPPAGDPPRTSSFPSSHTALATAFITAVAPEMPWVAVPVLGLASAVAWSRMKSVRHYPADVVGGGVVGWSSTLLVRTIGARWSALSALRR
jgi:undecaprenyl-diphosphatase